MPPSRPHRTKVVATLGPALDAPGALERTLAAGVDVVRVNLSHAPVQAQAERVRRARAIRPNLAVLVDLAGPKLRLGELPADLPVAAGDVVELGGPRAPVADRSVFTRVRPGDPVYIADGTIALEAQDVSPDLIRARAIVGGILRSRKGINLPADRSSLPCLTEKDRADLAHMGALDADFVALSYVRSEQDIESVRALTRLPVVAKIEKQQALDRIDAILAVADAIMVARGDLGVEMPIERVPAAQKRLIHAANLAGRPVITATQMMVSMVESPLPTRAEVTDVANAVLDGTDAVMLSEETAVGRDPAGVVAMMGCVIAETEPLLPENDGNEGWPAWTNDAGALARAATRLAADLDAVAIIAPTRTGVSAQRLSGFRPRRPILAYSRVPATTRRLALTWGVEPIDHAVPAGADPVIAALEAARRDLGAGARVVLFDIAPEGERGVPSLVNAITL